MAPERVRQDDSVYRCRHDNAQEDFGDSPRGDVKDVARVERARDADDCYGVTGQDKAVGGKVSRVLRTEGAKTDPEGKRAEEENALLGEERDEQQRNSGAHQCPDDAIEALRQDRPALLRLRDDEDGEQRPIGLVKVEGERDKQSDQARRRRLGRENPRNRVGPGERLLPVWVKRGVDAVRPIVLPRVLRAYNIR